MFKWLGLGPEVNVGREDDSRYLKVQYPEGRKANANEDRSVKGYI